MLVGGVEPQLLHYERSILPLNYACASTLGIEPRSFPWQEKILPLYHVEYRILHHRKHGGSNLNHTIRIGVATFAPCLQERL